MIPVKSEDKSFGTTELSQPENMHSDTAEVRKTLMEARESLSSCLSDSNKTHYVACIPSLSNTIKVYSDFGDVLKLMKEHKNQNPRMLSFPSLAEAEAFANMHTAYEVCQGTTIKSNYPQEKAEVELAELKLFPSLTTPQLNEFRIFLEKGNLNSALERILSNPRFLVLSIDMPTILKEGPRYNALHASVIAGQLESCRMVMEMISDVEYLKRLYETQKRAEENSKRLIDLYLNTPDKVANKTPLHLASERGFVDIVAFLVSFKACIRNFNHHIRETGNKGGEQYEKMLVTGDTPEQVACSRYKGPNAASVRAKIVDLIRGGTCYVPLIRSDTTGPYAKVGDPYTPTSPYKLVSEIENVQSNRDIDTKDFRNMKVWAFAGPMSPTEAEDFRKEWKSPRFIRKNHIGVRENHKVLDGDRGFERFGRELADCHATSWQEYWPFLDAFADLRSEEGLDKLDTFFQKQHVINLMQTLLRKVDFIAAPPFHINKDYVLIQDLSDSEEESEEENEVYFSAESPSCSEDDVLDSSDTSTLATCTEKTEDTTITSPSKSSGGVFSSLWSGIIKLKNIFSPGPGKGRHNTSNLANTPVRTTQSESVSQSGYNKTDSEQSQSETLGGIVTTDDLSSCQNEISQLGCIIQTCSQNNQPDNIAEMDITEVKSNSQLLDSTQSDQDLTGSPPLTSTKVVEYADTETPNVQNSDSSDSSHTAHAQNVIVHAHNFSGAEMVLKRKADEDMYRTPDKRKYRTRVESPESDSSSPEKDSSSCYSPPSFDLGCISPASQTGSGQDSLPVALLDDSFNSKMDSFSRSLQQFSMLSPSTSPSVSTITTPSSPSSKLDSDTEPSIHIFTGKLFYKFLSELKSRKLTDTDICDDQNQLPTIFLRQSDPNSVVLADVYLPGSQGINSLSKAQGHILDEYTHKEAVKNVWINFLVIFTTPNEAKRISSLSKDEVVYAVIEGSAEEKEACNISSFNKLDHGSLSELFMKSRDSLCESKHLCTMVVRIVRSSTLPSRDVFVCGTIPTKVDADVYHTLNSRACQLIRKQPSRFSHVAQWYHKMSNQGTDCINSLPSPSRVLRSERREPPPVSPLVGTPLRLSSQQPIGVSSSVTVMGGKQNESYVRNLFSRGNKNGGN